FSKELSVLAGHLDRGIGKKRADLLAGGSGYGHGQAFSFRTLRNSSEAASSSHDSDSEPAPPPPSTGLSSGALTSTAEWATRTSCGVAASPSSGSTQRMPSEIGRAS